MQKSPDNSLFQASIIIPALNEAENIGILLEETKRKLEKKINMEIIVVDAGSSDATYIVAKEADVTVIRKDHHLRYGESLREGICYSAFSTIVVFDASGEYDPNLIIDGLRLLYEGKGDIAVANYTSSRPLTHRIGSGLISLQTRLLFNLRLSGDLSSTSHRSGD